MDSDHSEKEPKPQLPDLIQGDAASEPDDNHYNPESQTETSTDGSSETEQIPSQTHIADKKVTKQSTQRTRGGVEGRVLELTGRVDNIELAYMYGFFSVGGRVYQIVCFTQGRNYSEFQASFSKIISSFEPAPALPQSTPPDSGTDTLSGAE